jgi:Tfp pilus assembly pilus retraction ATPase PilT
VTKALLKLRAKADKMDFRRRLKGEARLFMPNTFSEEARTRLRIRLIQPEALELISDEMARKYTVIPLAIKDNTLQVAMANPPVKNLVREGKIYQLPNVIRTHARIGMALLDQALLRLYHSGVIDSENMLAFCNDRDEIERLIGSGVGIE